MEIIIASIVFYIVGLIIGGVFSKLKSQGQSGQIELLMEQKNVLEQQLSSQSTLVQTLEPLQDQVRELRLAAERAKDAQGRDAEAIRQQLLIFNNTNEAVRTATQQLATALTKNTERGRLGEVQLEQIINASGLVLAYNYDMQPMFSVNGKDIKPDCVIKFPDGTNIVIDAKVPFDKFEASLATQDEAQRKQLLKEHAVAVLRHARELTDKNYHSITKGFEFVILFMPFPSLLDAAIEGNPNIVRELEKIKIIPVTPTSLIAVMNMVHITWKRNDLANHITEISKLASGHLNALNKMFEHLQRLGNAISASVNAFNEVARRFQNSVLETAKKLRNSGITTDRNLPDDINQVDNTVIELTPTLDIEQEPEE